MKNFLTAALFLAMAGGVCSAQSDSQSLADVAKQNRQNKKAVRVINEDDLAASEGVVSVVGDESARAADSAPVSPQKTPAGPGKAAPSDSDPKVADLNKKLDSYKKEQQGWKDSAKQYEKQLANETNDFRRATYQQAMENDKTNAANLQQKIDQTNADLAKAQADAASQSTAASKPAGAAPPGSQQ